MLAKLARGWRAIPLLIKDSGARQVHTNLKLANYEHANQPLYINWFANLAMERGGGVGSETLPPATIYLRFACPRTIVRILIPALACIGGTIIRATEIKNKVKGNNYVQY
jgi:hypothetical protein